MWDGEERRESPRLRTSAPAEYRTISGSGTGTVYDISMSGVRVEEASTPLKDGDTVWLRCSFFIGSYSVELIGRVARQTSPGLFALQFLELEPDQLGLLNRVTRY